MQLKGQLNDSFGWQEMKYKSMDAYLRCLGEGTTSDRDEAISAFTSWMKFVPSSYLRLLKGTLFLSTQISAETAAEDMSIFTIFPWEQLIQRVEM